MEFIDLKKQYLQNKFNIERRINNVLAHGKFIGGHEVEELEKKLAKYVGVKHAITCANGTDALTLSLMSLGIKQGDIVFCPTFTYFASAESIAFLGATPVFVDCCYSTFNMCHEDLEKKIIETLDLPNHKQKCIMTVDLFGLPADYEKIKIIAEKYNLDILEDAAQGFGGSIEGKKAGSFGKLSCTSFFPAKPLGCYGDGGAIFTNDNNLNSSLRSLKEHGKGADKYDNIQIGMNSRLDTIQAAILLEKLQIFDDELVKRNNLANKYFNQITNKRMLPEVPSGFSSSWAQFTLKVDDRDDVQKKLKNKGIPTMIYYKKCMHKQDAFSEQVIKKLDLNTSEELSKKVLSIPMHPYMDDRTSEKIISEVNSIL